MLSLLLVYGAGKYLLSVLGIEREETIYFVNQKHDFWTLHSTNLCTRGSQGTMPPSTIVLSQRFYIKPLSFPFAYTFLNSWIYPYLWEQNFPTKMFSLHITNRFVHQVFALVYRRRVIRAVQCLYFWLLLNGLSFVFEAIYQYLKEKIKERPELKE